MKNIVVAGGGVLGSQIAFQSAYYGFNVTIWLRSEGSITRTKPKLDHLKKVYTETINKMGTKRRADKPELGQGEFRNLMVLMQMSALRKRKWPITASSLNLILKGCGRC